MSLDASSQSLLQPLALLRHEIGKAAALKTAGGAPSNEDNIDRSVAYLKSHLTERLGPGKLASIARMSRSHFFVLFRIRVGQSPTQYLIRLRMLEGARLLEETTMDVKNIASAVGYQDEFYFSRLFKMAFGVSPSRYRFRWLERRKAA